MSGVVNILKTPVAVIIPKMILYVQRKEVAWKVYSHLLGEGIC